MRNGSRVFDLLDRNPCRLQSGDSGLATRSRPLYPNFDFLDSEFGGFLSSLLGCHLTGKRCALSGALKAARPSTCPAQRISTRVGDRDMGVVERRFDERDRRRHIAAHLAAFVVRI